MKKYIPDLLAIFRIASSPVILFLILADGSSEGLMLIPAIIAFIAAWTDFFDGRLARNGMYLQKLGHFWIQLQIKSSSHLYLLALHT